MEGKKDGAEQVWCSSICSLKQTWSSKAAGANEPGTASRQEMFERGTRHVNYTHKTYYLNIIEHRTRQLRQALGKK